MPARERAAATRRVERSSAATSSEASLEGSCWAEEGLAAAVASRTKSASVIPFSGV